MVFTFKQTKNRNKNLNLENIKLKKENDELKKMIENFKCNSKFIEKRKEWLNKTEEVLSFLDIFASIFLNHRVCFNIFGGFIRNIVSSKSNYNIDKEINIYDENDFDIDLYTINLRSKGSDFKNLLVKIFENSKIEISEIIDICEYSWNNGTENLTHLKLKLNLINSDKVYSFDIFNKNPEINMCDYTVNNLELCFSDYKKVNTNLRYRNDKILYGEKNYSPYKINSINLLYILAQTSVNIAEPSFKIYNKVDKDCSIASIKKLYKRQNKMIKKKFYIESKFKEIEDENTVCKICYENIDDSNKIPKYCSSNKCNKNICSICIEKITYTNKDKNCPFCRGEFQFSLKVSTEKLEKIFKRNNSNIKSKNFYEITCSKINLNSHPFSSQY